MEYKLIRKKRKTLGIKVSETGEIIVYAPFKTNINIIDEIVKTKEQWIIRALNKIKNYGNYSKITFFGKVYDLNIIKTADKKDYIELDQRKINFYCCEENPALLYIKLKDYLYKNYKNDFKMFITPRIYSLAAQIGVIPNKISVKNQKTIWGSCSRDNNISINFRLALAPLEVTDYILVHELCHIIHKNHSKQFWMAVQSFMPDYNIKRNWLNANSHKVLF